MNTTGRTTRFRVAARSLCVSVALIATVMCQAARSEMIDGIVAVVDDTVIMYSDVLRKMRDLGAGDLGDAEHERNAQRQVLQVMIEDAVVNKVYRRMGLQPVDLRHAEQAARDMNIDIASARSMLMKSTLMDIMVKSRVVVTEAMIREYYEHTKEYAGVPSVRLKQILVRSDADKAGRALDEIRSGRGFDEVAASHSELLVSGSPDIGWVALDHLAPEAHAVIEKAGPGDVVGPVTVDGTTLIFQVVDRGVSGATPLEEVRDEIVESLQDRYRTEAFNYWLRMIMTEHYIGIFL